MAGATKLTVAVAQIDPRLGDVDTNLALYEEQMRAARGLGADVVVFPELSLSGYFLKDMVSSVAVRLDSAAVGRLKKLSRRRALIAGLVEETDDFRFYNSAVYFQDGEIIHVHRKVYLPTYGLFDEGRFFAWGDSIRAFDTRFGRVGILICEDFWHASPPYLLWLDGADLMLFMSASPGRGITHGDKLESAWWVEHINRAYASLFTSYVAHTNRVGFEDGLHFWGGATVFDPNGDLVAQGPYQEEALTVADLDLDQLHRTRARLPLLRDERHALVRREIERITGGDTGARDKG